MPDAIALELASLPHRHPDLGSALSPHAMMAVIRLKVDPTPPVPFPNDAVSRMITISHRSKGLVADSSYQREIGWGGLGFTEVVGVRICNTHNSHEITEKAAIAVMGLVAHELEEVQLKRVLQIGSGGDYAVNCRGQPIQVEVSGIRQGHPSDSHSRLAQKREQVLKRSSQGFVSVTTFCQASSGGGVVHSFLHHVKSIEPSQPSRKDGSRRKRR